MTAHLTLPTAFDVDLPGLSAEAGRWFAHMPVEDGRVQSTPDSRALRFYQSTGLLDRPLRYDGRSARYGRRHLLQVLAVRALQSHGMSLAQIQPALAGATDSALEQTVHAVVRPRTEFNSLVDPVEPAPSPHELSELTAVELAPGLIVTIDSRLHHDPARLIARLRAAIPGDQS